MEKSGLLFNIQRFSIHDGPGIRTAVFFKGCPLRCPWCSNPESQSNKIQITWDRKKCIGCGDCINACNQDAISMTNDKKLITIDGNRCNACMKCREACPTGAISYEGYYRTVDEVMDIVMKDEPFYSESGGGITLTGGEVLSQPGFAKSLLMAAKAKGIHTAMETTCFGQNDRFLEILENLDLLLCDIKHWDSVRHQEVTGVPTELIHENIRTAVDYPGLHVIGRIPVIPGFNYTVCDAEMLSKKVISLGISKVHLLSYHSFGEGKYELLGREYKMKGVDQIHRDDPSFLEYTRIFKESGLEVI